MSSLDPRRATAFGRYARDYDRWRPAYPDAAVDWLLPSAATRVADVGAGTGKLTGMLVARGLQVDAVEPDGDMLAVLQERWPQVRPHRAGADALPLDDASVDAVGWAAELAALDSRRRRHHAHEGPLVVASAPCPKPGMSGSSSVIASTATIQRSISAHRRASIAVACGWTSVSGMMGATRRQGRVPSMTLIARFSVDRAEPTEAAGMAADWVGLLIFSKTFSAGIKGSATTLFMSAGTDDGARAYVATERITGRVEGGQDGSVVVQHGGLESDPATWFGHIVPGTGTGGFAGWAGSARIQHDDEGAYFEIDLAG